MESKENVLAVGPNCLGVTESWVGKTDEPSPPTPPPQAEETEELAQTRANGAALDRRPKFPKAAISGWDRFCVSAARSN